MSASLIGAAIQAASMTGRFTLPAICDAISLPASEREQRDLVWRALAPEATEHVTENGTYCWQIGPDARRHALSSFYALSQLDSALTRALPAHPDKKPDPSDHFGVALQAILRREPIELSDPPGTASSRRLRAALNESAAYLDAVQFVEDAPAFEHVKLEVRLARNEPYAQVDLQRFKQLTAAKIKQLQALSDIRTVLPKQHYGYSTQRIAISRFARGETKDSTPLLLTGVAGAGKSALLSRLILGWQRSQPDMIVVTLDFDRRQLNAGEPIELMQEFLRQIMAKLSLQGNELSDPLVEGLRQIRSDLSVFKTSSTDGSRESNDQQASDIRSVFRLLGQDWAAPLREKRIALVLDTFEAIDRMAAFERLADDEDRDQTPENVVVTQIMRLFGEVQSNYLNEMRIVVSGREEPLTRTGQIEIFGKRLRLRGLSEISGAKLLQKEAKGYGDGMVATFSDTDKARHVSGLLDGHPLALIAFVRYVNDNPDDIDALIHDLESRGGFKAEFAQVFLYRRILDRISDTKVRMLAHPGLMLRQLNVDAIENILAEACLDRGPASENPLHSVEAADLFNRLRNQYWLVEKVEGRRDLVRHVPDLRRMMLDGLLAGPSKMDKGERKEKKLDLQRRALEVCRIAAMHYRNGDAKQKLDAIYYGSFSMPAPENMTGEEARRLDRHLGVDVDTMPIDWRARIKYALGRIPNVKETETLNPEEQEEVRRRSFADAQKAGFTTAARSSRKRTEPVADLVIEVPEAIERADEAEVTPEDTSVHVNTDIDDSGNVALAHHSLARLGEDILVRWNTGDLHSLFAGSEDGESNPVSRLLRAAADQGLNDEHEFWDSAARNLFQHPIHIAALILLATDHELDWNSHDVELEAERHVNEPLAILLHELAVALMQGDFARAVGLMRACVQNVPGTSPIANNRAIGMDVNALFKGQRHPHDEAPEIAMNGMSQLAGVPNDGYGQILPSFFGPANFFFDPLQDLYRAAEHDDMTLAMVERAYRSASYVKFDKKMLDEFGQTMFPIMFRGPTPELHGPLSAILGRLEFHAGEDVTLRISGRHPMWPSDLRFDDQFLYSPDQAPTIVETADRAGVLPDLIRALEKHDNDVWRLMDIHTLVSKLYFGSLDQPPVA